MKKLIILGILLSTSSYSMEKWKAYSIECNKKFSKKDLSVMMTRTFKQVDRSYQDTENEQGQKGIKVKKDFFISYDAVIKLGDETKEVQGTISIIDGKTKSVNNITLNSGSLLFEDPTISNHLLQKFMKINLISKRAYLHHEDLNNGKPYRAKNCKITDYVTEIEQE